MDLFEIDRRQLGSNKKIHDIYVRDPRRQCGPVAPTSATPAGIPLSLLADEVS